jgi:hypothetical protein
MAGNKSVWITTNLDTTNSSWKICNQNPLHPPQPPAADAVPGTENAIQRSAVQSAYLNEPGETNIIPNAAVK